MTIALVGTLALFELIWELWLAPLRPGGSWLALKALPLCAIWPSLARDRRKARQWAALVLPFYIAEALVRAATESGRHAIVAGTAALIGVAAFTALLMSFRAERRD
jgi:uncharacterized membrane protein